MESITRSLGERIKLARKRAKFTQPLLAEKLGITKRTLINYENNVIAPKKSIIKQMAIICDINESWLENGYDEDFFQYFDISAVPKYYSAEKISITRQSSNSASNVIPVQGHFYKVIMSINAGDPLEIYREENYTGEDVFFPYEKSERCFALKVVGDSMESSNYRSVSEGEFVVVDMDAEILNGDIVVVHLVNGRQMIKQYVAGQDDTIILHSFNPEHPDITVKEADVQAMMRVVGKALLKRF